MEEAGNPLYYARNYYNIKDVDLSFDEFIVFFKEKYLKNIQLETETDTRRLIKHSLDIYRSKGTERCVQLLFQLVFNKPVRFYYPSLDLFKLSDGQWYKPKYLELRLSEKNIDIVYKQIRGNRSGAIAYVDSVVRRRIKGRLIDVAYISAIAGNFQVHERVIPIDESIIIDDCPTVTGSLTGLGIVVTGTGSGYANGDVLALSSDYGDGGSGLVLETVEQFGIIEATLASGGYGYQANSTTDHLYVSETNFTLADFTFLQTGLIKYFSQFETLSQTQAYINYISATGNFAVNEDVFTYYGNGAVMGHGFVLEVNPLTSNTGTILTGVLTGNLANTFYTSSNVVTANLAVSNGFSQANATGKIVANDAFVVITTNGSSGTFLAGETIVQPSAQGKLYRVGGNTLTINTQWGIFKPEYNVTGLTTGATANIGRLSLGVGLSNVSGTFYAYSNNIVSTNNITGTITRLELGSGFDVVMSNNLLYPETILINTDLLTGYLATNLNAAVYGFPANGSANLTSVTINNSLTYANATIGKIENAFVANPGTDYTKPPFIKLDHSIRALQYHDFHLQLAGATGSFTEGELITQSATSARGIIRECTIDEGNTYICVEGMRFNQNNWFVTTSNSTTTILGSRGSVANIASITYDMDSEVMGHNFEMDTSFTIGEGAILTMQVVDSGFGFLPGEEVQIGETGVGFGFGTANVLNQGTGAGYYRKKGGFLSDQKKLFDGFFWQNYSYQIISSLMLSKYQKLLKQLTHPAGTMMFGLLQHDTQANGEILAGDTSVSVVFPMDVANGVYVATGKTANLTHP